MVEQSTLAAMQEVNRLFGEEVCRRRNFDAVEQIYTRDAIIFPPGSSAITGVDSIRSYWVNACPEMDTIYCRLDPIETTQSGDFAYEAADVEVGTRDGPLAVNSLIVWRRESGVWKWHRDIWNLKAKPA